jgi:hypothetical protein
MKHAKRWLRVAHLVMRSHVKLGDAIAIALAEELPRF